MRVDYYVRLKSKPEAVTLTFVKNWFELSAAPQKGDLVLFSSAKMSEDLRDKIGLQGRVMDVRIHSKESFAQVLLEQETNVPADYLLHRLKTEGWRGITSYPAW